MVVAAEVATTVVLVAVVMMMEDVISKNSKNVTAVEKEGMMCCTGRNSVFCEEVKKEKKVGLCFVYTKFIL